MTTAVGDDPYLVLGVGRGASDAEIARAYRALARRFHPDRAGEAATPQMMRVNAAFDAIRDAGRRGEFEASERAQDGGAPAAESSRTRTRGHGTASGAAPTDATASQSHRTRRRPERDGTGGAGPPPGRPSGSVLTFGRHIGWSLGEVARHDPGYLEWLETRREGRPYREEIDTLLKRIRYRKDPADAVESPRKRPLRGVFRG